MVSEDKVREIKEKTIRLCINAGIGHVTSAFSIAEVVCILYYEIMKINPGNPCWSDRDRFVLSKNHASVITFPILEELGFLRIQNDFLKNGSSLGIHTKLGVKGIDFCGGSLGIGLGVACGMAYGAKLDDKNYMVFTVIGDGECYEGSIWEAVLFAAANKLDNLVVFIDRNRMCITDFTENMLPIDSLNEKFKAFNWDVKEINGHDLDEIRRSLTDVRAKRGKPLCIILNTVKGKGVSFLENALFWHGKAPKGELAEQALVELEEVRYDGKSN